MRILSLTSAICLLMMGASDCRDRTPQAPKVESDSALPELVIYTYDSMVAEGGLGPRIFPLFEKECGCKIRALAAGDAGAMIARLQLDAERGKPKAHVVLGLDQNTWESIRPRVANWNHWKPKGYDSIPKDLKVADGFLPFDYGVFAFIADMKALKKAKLAPPANFKELAEPQWHRNFILQDPRTSTPGLAFFSHLNTYFQPEPPGQDEGLYVRIAANALASFPGWDAAYGAFLKGEAPLVWSYITSEAYHREEKQGERYKALVFSDPHPIQVEGAALVLDTFKSPEERARGERFLEFLISPAVQSAIPKGNWMMPVIPGTPLPDSFRGLPQPTKRWMTKNSMMVPAH